MSANRISIEDLGVFALLAKALAVRPSGRAESKHADAREDNAPAPKRGLMDRLDHWFWNQDQKATEAYLAQAKDVYELEVRIRDLERRTPSRYY